MPAASFRLSQHRSAAMAMRQIGAGLLAVGLLGAPTARAQTETVRSSAAFVDNIGINTHVDFNWSAYADFEQVKHALSWLGVRNVRDAIDNPADPPRFSVLAHDLGVKFDLFVAPGALGGWQLQQMRQHPELIRFVEGANEADQFAQTYNGLTGSAAARTIQADLHAMATTHLPGVKVIQSSLGNVDHFATALPDPDHADLGNAHIFFGSGNAPGDGDWIDHLRDLAKKITPGRNVVVTETGYYTSANENDPHAVSPAVQAKYLLATLFEEVRAGLGPIYVYELVDQQPDPAGTNPQLHFGLFNNNWQPKPAAGALRNLLQVMRGPAGTAPPQPTPQFTLQGPDGLHHVLFRRPDGAWLLALWPTTRLSGPQRNRPISVAPVAVSLQLAAPASWQLIDPLAGTAPVQSGQDTKIALMVPDHAMLVLLRPTGAHVAEQ
jgi:hypothetical protein